MKTIKKSYAILTLLLIINCSCNNTSNDMEERVVNIKFNNGLVFCMGKHSVNKKTGEPKNRVGLWRFYYPNGKITSEYEYDSYGEMINEKSYNEYGSLVYSEIRIDNVTTSIRFFDNGQIEREVISRLDFDGETEILYETQKTYYMNGQLYNQKSLEDGIIQGTNITYDSTGAIILKLEYKNGLFNIK